MNTQTYFRRAFSVEAVQVTDETFDEVAEWCVGEKHADPAGRYIKVQVHKPMSPRQTKAYIGDWLLKSDRGFKVYTDKAFKNGFLKDEDGKISQGWESVISHNNNVFDSAESETLGSIVDPRDAISGKR